MMSKTQTRKLMKHWSQELANARTGHRTHVCQTVIKVLNEVLGD